MKNLIIIAIVSLVVGGFIGAKVMELLGREYIMANLPVPKGTIDDKDVFFESLPEPGTVPRKELQPVNRKAKNVILLIGDGMSISQISSYRLLKGGPNKRLAVDRFPVSGIVLTHSANAIVTDSASSATAYSTGSKTNNTYLGLDKDKNILENLTERLDRYGLVSALIATSEVTHATPAAFAAHVDLRWKTDEISRQMLASNVSTILGGGRHFFLPERLGGKREDGRNLLEEIKESHEKLEATLINLVKYLNEKNPNNPPLKYRKVCVDKNQEGSFHRSAKRDFDILDYLSLDTKSNINRSIQSLNETFNGRIPEEYKIEMPK